MHFEIHRGAGKAGRWSWRLRDAAQRIIALGEGYRNRAECLHAIDLVRGTSSQTPVIDESDA